MPANVPTMDDFISLQDRVTRLEQGEQPRPPQPEPGEGVQAKRIADVVELFGVNTFSSLDDGNLWGSWPADYRPESVVAALKYMTDGTGFAFRLREYHYAGRQGMQTEWLRKIIAEIPGTRVAICPGANASTNDAATMVALAQDPACHIDWIEGLNEPNTNFGSGEVNVETTKAIQDAVWRGANGKIVLGPSIVAGTPHPEGWIIGYCAGHLDAINAAMHAGNGHYYPPGCPDVPDTGYSTGEYVGGLWTAYAQHPIHLTEFHPTLYNSEGHKPDEPGWTGERDAYYTLLTLLRCAQCGVDGLWWYALFDYGTDVYRCGLFPRRGTDEPRKTATVLRNFCQIVADRGANARSFTPGELDVFVQGLPDENWDLYQASDGRFLLALWHAHAAGGSSQRVTVSFGNSVGALTEFEPLASPLPVRTQHNVMAYDVALPAGVCILEIVR